jgi:hypothetical protein
VNRLLRITLTPAVWLIELVLVAVFLLACVKALADWSRGD